VSNDLFYKKMTERSDSILRHSIFDILRFDTTELVAGCGSLFFFVKFHTSGASGLNSGQSNRKRNFGLVLS